MVEDVFEEMAKSLKSIERSMGGADEGASTTVTGMGSAKSLGPEHFIVTETDDMDSVDPGGTVHLEPGDRKVIAEWEAQGRQNIALLAVGADDAVDVQYELVADYNTTIGSQTNSPLGPVNNPFSFIKNLNGYIPAKRIIQYKASLPASSTTSADLAARMFVSQGPPGGQ